MFKKLKDKLAEEVKSSPQRIQQFAQAAQAAVTSASSSISDITNSDLFSIGDNDAQQSRPALSPSSPDVKNATFQDISLNLPSVQGADHAEFEPAQDLNESQRQRRLSNSSFASDVSFRLPSYESPSMYHLQSDMDVSASEAEERGFSSGKVSLDRVTKEQIYAAYRRTQERYTKYRTQYADLARHYKLLERENAKAKSVLVETQDKALRRISELREQCSLEQSAKAHLEKALRVDIEEKNLKIETLITKIKLLQEHTGDHQETKEIDISSANNNSSNIQLISFDGENNHMSEETTSSETVNLNNRIEKMEKLLTKYKESLKAVKEKNAQLTTEIQILSGEVGAKNKEIDQLKSNAQQLEESYKKIQELKDLNEELQNQINVFDFNKNKEVTTLELDLQRAQEQIADLQSKINVFSKREEEYAISLAENKLSIHKELENKESEIKSLKDHLKESKQEIQSLEIVLDDYKTNITKLEDECSKHKNDITSLNTSRLKISELESQLQVLTQKFQVLESTKSKGDEEYKCLQLQFKQETAEKMAMIDRNTYLENRNTQLTEENTKKSLQISTLEKELQSLNLEKESQYTEDCSDKTSEEVEIWKNKCTALESEIQEEKEELGKLQSEIEKLLTNDDLIQMQNSQLRKQVDELLVENKTLKSAYKTISTKLKEIKRMISLTGEEALTFKETNNSYVKNIKEHLDSLSQQYTHLYKENVEHYQIHKTEIEQFVQQLDLLRDENLKLELQLKDYENSKIETEKQMQLKAEEYERSLNEIISVRKEKDESEEHLEESRAKYQNLQSSYNNILDELNILKQKTVDMTNNSISNNEALKRENDCLNKLMEESKVKCEQLQDIVNRNNNEKIVMDQNITDLTEKANEFKRNIDILQTEKQELIKEIEETNAKCEILQDIVNRNNNNQTALKQTINSLEHAIDSIKNEKLRVVEELNELNTKCESLQDIVSRNKIEQTNLKDNISKLKQENDLLSAEVEDLKKGIDNNISNYKEEQNELVRKLKQAEENQTTIEKLQQQINDVTQENYSLKNQSQEITNSINHLEIELQEVRKSHNEIEIEKYRLSAIIQQFETNEKMCQAKITQTGDNNGQSNDVEATFATVQLLDDDAIPSSNENKSAFKHLVQENELLKEENKRLQSDVAGIQSYLAKISKENSVLNDKLRELMASSENTQDNGNLSDLSYEITQGREKLDELIRENSLLEEENFELKDQLKSQHFTKNNSVEIAKEVKHHTLQEKYNSLLNINSRLENRMLDLEQMNKSANNNTSEMQQQNEKLKLTNEKLERRLDEALVSLRHLHALQENTELEYLRNILYEYLTGTGAHSITLAKVLAAVVKFDKTQTDQVIQKEKERQGFLRQLGLL